MIGFSVSADRGKTVALVSNPLMIGDLFTVGDG